jgi:hypothetical protein
LLRSLDKNIRAFPCSSHAAFGGFSDARERKLAATPSRPVSSLLHPGEARSAETPAFPGKLKNPVIRTYSPLFINLESVTMGLEMR